MSHHHHHCKHGHGDDDNEKDDTALRRIHTTTTAELELTPDNVSELTLAGIATDGPFDLEKFLRKVMKE